MIVVNKPISRGKSGSSLNLCVSELYFSWNILLAQHMRHNPGVLNKFMNYSRILGRKSKWSNTMCINASVIHK